MGDGEALVSHHWDVMPVVWLALLFHTEEGEMEAQRRFLEEATLSQVVENKPALVWVEPSTTVASVCDELRLHNILSLPVYSKEVPSNPPNA